MNKTNSFSFVVIFLSLVFVLTGCSSTSTENISNLISTENAKLLYEETLAPNEAYVTSEEDLVKYYIEIYQDENFKIIVNASSNSQFIKEQQYTLDFDKQITEKDVKVSWTTLMGNPEASADMAYFLSLSTMMSA